MTPAEELAIEARLNDIGNDTWMACLVCRQDGTICTCGLIWSKSGDCCVAHVPSEGENDRFGTQHTTETQIAVAKFISNAPTDIRMLLDELRAERKKVADLEHEIQGWHEDAAGIDI